jgi:hypothetical protein
MFDSLGSPLIIERRWWNLFGPRRDCLLLKYEARSSADNPLFCDIYHDIRHGPATDNPWLSKCIS